MAATNSGHWPLYRYDPRTAVDGRNPLTLDSRAPKIAFKDYAYAENRYRTLLGIDPGAPRRSRKRPSRTPRSTGACSSSSRR